MTSTKVNLFLVWVRVDLEDLGPEMSSVAKVLPLSEGTYSQPGAFVQDQNKKLPNILFIQRFLVPPPWPSAGGSPHKISSC